MSQTYTLQQINAMDRATFTRTLGGIFEHSPWIAEAAWARRPFASVAGLHAAMLAELDAGGESAQLALIRAHPELAGKAAVRGELTEESKSEQRGAGLDQCSPEEFARLTELNAAYGAKFGFPFILAVRGHTRESVLANMAARIDNDPAVELRTALEQIARIGELRLNDLIVG